MSSKMKPQAPSKGMMALGNGLYWIGIALVVILVLIFLITII